MRRLLYFLLFGLVWPADAQNTEPKPQNPTTAVVRAFDNHNIVMFGEEHGCKQEYAWLRDLVATPEFADRVDDIVVEFGNSLYQAIVILSGNWVGALPLFDEGFPGKSPALAETADALLFLAHSREDLTVLRVPRAELEGTAYGKELDRRMMIISGRHLVMPEKAEEPLGP